MKPLRIADAADSAKVQRRLSLKTQARHLTALSSYWVWMVDNRLVAKSAENPFYGLGGRRRRKRLREARRERPMWTPPQLAKLFASPLFTGCRSRGRRSKPGTLIIRDERFWIPLIGVFSLMRLEEICQLLVEDVLLLDGIWMFRVSDGDRDDRHGEGVQRQLKNDASRRLVPIHRTLLDIGVLELIDRRRSPKERLFPQLKPSRHDGKLGAHFSQWWTRYRRGIGCYWPGVDFHALRHTGTTLLANAGIPDSWIDEISGHESVGRRDEARRHVPASETRRYTKAIWHENLKSAIDKIDLDLDIHHLVPTRDPEI